MLCMSRRAAGKPALAIAWGPVDHVGYVAEILKVCTPFLSFHVPSLPSYGISWLLCSLTLHFNVSDSQECVRGGDCHEGCC